MELTMSMYATPADYWKARAVLAEQTVRETAAELGCEPDNEAMLLAAQNATRYRWLAPRMFAADFDYNESGTQALVFEMPAGLSYGADCDEVVDAGMVAAPLGAA